MPVSFGMPAACGHGYRRTFRPYRIDWHRVFKERRAIGMARTKLQARGCAPEDPGAGIEPALLESKASVLPLDDPERRTSPAGVLTLRIDWPRWPARVGSEGIEPSPRRLRAGCASATLRARRVGREGLEPSSLRLKAGCLAHWASVPSEGRARAVRALHAVREPRIDGPKRVKSI